MERVRVKAWESEGKGRGVMGNEKEEKVINRESV